MELLPRGPRPPYRIRAEVRHEAMKGIVGFYFGDPEYRAGSDPEHEFFLAAFSEDSPTTGKLELTLQRYREALAGKGMEHFQTPLGTWATFTFDKGDVGWRPLIIEVDRNDLRLSWQGKVVSHPSLGKMQEQVERDHRIDPKHPAWRWPPPRGSMGLYLENGHAFWRNVIIEPFDP